ncbi:unannotated protein [freshwater metagenome]|uniref:Unannotated protein n=1 Tax=freshwater metagenome TaxID=449393 RepID=A0A6J7IPU4_9ZZZZ
MPGRVVGQCVVKDRMGEAPSAEGAVLVQGTVDADPVVGALCVTGEIAG